MAWDEEEALALEQLLEDAEEAALQRVSARELMEMEPKLNEALSAVFVHLRRSGLSHL